MRKISLNARAAHDAQNSGEVEVILLAFEHPDLDAPVRLSTDPSERLSTSPLIYGTRSTWLDADPVKDPYLFILASAEFPADQDDAAAAASIRISNVDQRIAVQLRSFVDRATVHLAVVLASSPNDIEAQYLDMRLMGAEGNSEEIVLQISRQPIEDENAPKDRFTRDRFPGLHR